MIKIKIRFNNCSITTIPWIPCTHPPVFPQTISRSTQHLSQNFPKPFHTFCRGGHQNFPVFMKMKRSISLQQTNFVNFFMLCTFKYWQNENSSEIFIKTVFFSLNVSRGRHLTDALNCWDFYRLLKLYWEAFMTCPVPTLS